MHPSRFALTFIVASTLALTGCDNAPADTHPNQPVTKRREIFKSFTKTLEPLGQVARDRKTFQATEVLEQARALQKLADQPWPLFTADSNYPPTQARPEVWEKAGEFTQAQQQYRQSVDRLVDAAAAPDVAQIKDAIHAVENSCKSCHDTFRHK